MVVECVATAAQDFGISYDAAFHLVCALFTGFGIGAGFILGGTCSFIMSFGLGVGQGLLSVLKKLFPHSCSCSRSRSSSRDDTSSGP